MRREGEKERGRGGLGRNKGRCEEGEGTSFEFLQYRLEDDERKVEESLVEQSRADKAGRESIHPVYASVLVDRKSRLHLIDRIIVSLFPFHCKPTSLIQPASVRRVAQ